MRCLPSVEGIIHLREHGWTWKQLAEFYETERATLFFMVRDARVRYPE